MTEEQIAEIMNMPFSQILNLCHDDRDLLRAMIGQAIQRGIAEGRQQAFMSYNRLMRHEGVPTWN